MYSRNAKQAVPQRTPKRKFVRLCVLSVLGAASTAIARAVPAIIRSQRAGAPTLRATNLIATKVQNQTTTPWWANFTSGRSCEKLFRQILERAPAPFAEQGLRSRLFKSQGPMRPAMLSWSAVKTKGSVEPALDMVPIIPAPRPLRHVEQLWLLAGCALLICLRMPEIVIRGRFWAEEGVVFFHNAWTLPWSKALLTPLGGYLPLIALRQGCWRAILCHWNSPPMLASQLPFSFNSAPLYCS